MCLYQHLIMYYISYKKKVEMSSDEKKLFARMMELCWVLESY